jgi:DNA-binding beta-propeller fold protein YncE
VSRWLYGDASVDFSGGNLAGATFDSTTLTGTVFNAATNIVRSTAIGGLPRQTRLSADGKQAYVVDFVRTAILAFDTVDNAVMGSIDVNGNPHALALEPDGEFLYLTDYRDCVVTVISTALLAQTAHRR